MALLREHGALDQFNYINRLGLDPDDAGWREVATGISHHGGIYLDAVTGEALLVNPGDTVPPGVWVAQFAIDSLKPERATATGHGFGEGFGTQGVQFGGDRSYPVENNGGGRRVNQEEPSGNLVPTVPTDLENSTAETGSTTGA